MRNLTLKIDPRHGEALSQMGEKEKRTRIAEFEKIVETAWDKFSNGKPLPVPRGATIQAYAQPGSIASLENQALARKQAELVKQAAHEVINEDDGEIDEFHGKFAGLCAEHGIKARALTQAELDQFNKTLEEHRNPILAAWGDVD